MAYHCNIIADGDSSELVPFVQFLERKINGWGYNCFIPDRDFRIGWSIYEQYLKMHSENKVTFVAITSPCTSEFRYKIEMLLNYQLHSSHSDIKRPALVPVFLNIDHLNDPVPFLDVIKPVRIYGSKEDEWEDSDSNSRAFSQLREVLMKYHPLAKAASEKDLSNISECIGSNWEMLAPFLIERNSAATVEQIKEDHRQSRQRVYALLCKWRAQTDDPSLAYLFHSMYQAGTSVTIDWRKIAYKLKVSNQDIQACKAGYPGQEQDTGQQQASGNHMTSFHGSSSQEQTENLDRKLYRLHNSLMTAIKDELVLDSDEYQKFIYHFGTYVGRGTLANKSLLDQLEVLVINKIITRGENYEHLKQICGDSGNQFLVPLIENYEKQMEDVRSQYRDTGSRMDSNKQAATEVYLKLLREATEALEESISKGYTAQNIADVVTAKLALEGDESIKPQLERIKDMFIEVIEGKPIQEILDIPKGYEYILKTFKDLLSHIEQTTGAKATDPKKACINLQFSCETEVEKLKLLKYFASDDHKYCIEDFANKISNIVGSPIGVHVSFKISDESLLSILQEGDSGRKSQKDSFRFDGRLILLDSNQIHALETSLDKNPIGQGGIGAVYRCNNQDIFGIPVAVKKIKTKSDPKIESHVRREKIACRLMNPFILPLLAVVEKSNEEFWFISPYCENGDLHDAIKRGKGQNNTDEININNQATRVKILLQIALAIQYIHTPVLKVRGPILHKDIASKNVVQDKYLNARLIDFGLAREKDDKSTIHGGRRPYDHPEIGHGKGAKEYHDYHSFGVIIREMLTSLEPEGVNGHFLMNMEKDQIEERIDKNVWNYKEVIQTLYDLSYKCLKCAWTIKDLEGNVIEMSKELQTEVGKYKGDIQVLNDLPINCLICPWTIEDFKANVIDELRDIMERTFVCEIFENKEENNCHQCIINPIAENSSLTEDYDNCRKKIRVCMACEKNNFLNPVICYCSARLSSKIGSKWGALLVAGDDESQEKADAMKNEILELERVVTSLAPRIMGISKDKVKTVVPGVTEESPIWPTIKNHIENFSEDGDINTLLIYFSCHGGSSADESMFELGKKTEYISLDEFQNELNKLHKIDRLIIFLDRCFPPKLTFEKRKFVQINACSEDKKAVLNKEGSLFTKYVIQGLKARSEERECSKDCNHCYSYWSSRTEYVSICSLYDYVNKHLELKAPQPDWKLESIWDNIAFFTDEVVEIEFTFHKEPSEDGGITIPLSLGYLKNIDEVKQKIHWDFKVDINTHEVKIRKDTFRNDQQTDDECTTLEQVMEAWVQRFPLLVTFHKKEGT